MRIRMLVAYDGGELHGWQAQPGHATVQGTLETALATVLGEPVRVEAAGRTDAGVHALGQVVAFSTEHVPRLDALERGINALAGPSIAVREVREADPAFDPRRDATARSYEYRLHAAPWPDPFARRTAWHVPVPVDAAAMDAAARVLLGRHDFSAFQAADCDADHAIREMTVSCVEREGTRVVYRTTATAFLRHMVRA